MNKLMKFYNELSRRHVVRLVGAYVAMVWLLAQGFASLFPALGWPLWIVRVFIIASVVLLPVIAWLSWKYNLKPPQIVRDEKDVEIANPSLAWAQRHHDNTDSGFVLLKWQAAEDKETEKRFFKAVSLGRGPNNDVQLIDERVSRHHAVLWAENGAWHVKDNSTNGTYINHVRVTQPTRLPQSCELQFHPNGPVVSVHIDMPAKTMVS